MRGNRLIGIVATLFLLALGATATASVYLVERRAHAHKVHDHSSHHHGARNVVASAAFPDERLSDVPCENGIAGPFQCDGVDLLSFVPLDEFRGIDAQAVLGGGTSDLWGWTDPETDDEYVIIGKTNGTAFFRVTNPTNPVYLGEIPNTAAAQLIWHDIKVYEDHAFIVSESNPHGMRVFDLTRLRGVTEPQTFVEDMRYPLNWAAHNIAINEETGYAYIVGGNEGIVVPDHCQAGLHMVDISDPMLPLFAGCYTGDGYVHDTQCVVYRGPDETHHDKEVCFNSSEDQVSIVDVTDKSNPVVLGRLTYPRSNYTHQGWLTEDQSHFLLGDEGDEQNFAMNTRTLILDVSDLDAPVLRGEHFGTTRAIDHNMYVLDRLVYQSNYRAGLRILDTAKVAEGLLTEVAFFDTLPGANTATFFGTWSNYPYFESGTIAVSGMDEGLFLLKVRPEVFEELEELEAPATSEV